MDYIYEKSVPIPIKKVNVKKPAINIAVKSLVSTALIFKL